MSSRLLLLLACVLLGCVCHAQIPGLRESHIAGNVPGTNDFRPFLIRDLTAYLKLEHGKTLELDYELLRDGPTQAGVGYPKYYLWLRATNAERRVIEGAVRVAAMDKVRFDVTAFVPQSEISSRPAALSGVFPKALIAKIRRKAGVASVPQTVRERLENEPDFRIYATEFSVVVTTNSAVPTIRLAKVIDPKSGTDEPVKMNVPDEFIEAAKKKIEARNFEPRSNEGKPAEFFTYFFYVPGKANLVVEDLDRPLDEQP